MQRISREHRTCLFGGDQQPVTRVSPGHRLLFETWDALGGRVKTTQDALTLSLPPTQLNPVTGPVWVQDTQPGDTLAVRICDIQLSARGQCRLKPGAGVIIDELQPPAANLIPVQDGVVHFNERIRFAARPMVGTIGVAPAGDNVSSFHPGPHGGNLDINEAGIGATIYLPVAVPGALLAMGDVHATMGDGELTGGGVDINADVTVELGILRDLGWQRPVIETVQAWCTCASASTLADAVRLATRDMVTLLARRLHMSREESFILVGAAGDARLGQASESGIDATAYVRISKEILPSAF